MIDGSEIRPAYSCSVSISSEFMMKHEYDTITTRTPHRTWRRVSAELRGTMLIIRPVHAKPVQLWNTIFKGTRLTSRRQSVKAYTLQGGEAGVAMDYGKRPFVIRVRVEAEQFLLSADNLKIMLSWLECLTAAIDISLPLELRKMPKNRTLPRAAGRAPAAPVRDAPPSRDTASSVGSWSPVTGNGNHTSTSWSPVAGSIHNEPQSQPQQQAPTNTFSFNQPQNTGFNNTNFTSTGFRPATSPTPSRTQCPCSGCGPSSPTPVRRTFVSQAQRISTLSTDTAETAYSMALSVDIGSDGKWAPPKSTATKAAEMDYEKRCAKVVTYASPRRYDWYVQDGLKVRIDRSAVSRALTLHHV